MFESLNAYTTYKIDCLSKKIDKLEHENQKNVEIIQFLMKKVSELELKLYYRKKEEQGISIE